MSQIDDPILLRFRARLDDLYQDRLEKMVLFGSRARGDHGPDSDYDVAIFISELAAFSDELSAIADIETDILYETGKVINGLPLNAGSWRDSTLFMQEIRRDGVEL